MRQPHSISIETPSTAGGPTSLGDGGANCSHTGAAGEMHSLFEDFLKIGSVFFDDADSSSIVFVLYSALFPLFEIVFSIVLLCMVVPKIINGINTRQDIKNSTMRKYNEMKLTGSKHTRQNFFRQQSIVSIIIYAVFDIVFTLIFGKLFYSISDMSNGEFVPTMVRYMDGFAGFSGWSFLLLAMLVAFIVIRSMIKKEEKAMLLEITQEQYN